ALARVALADAHRELAVAGELQDLIVIDRLQSGDAVGGAVVAGDPHKAFRVDVDAVLTLGPLRTGVLTAPALDERAGGVEHHHRRRGRRGLAWLQRARAM